MTRKDYILIASAIKEVREQDRDSVTLNDRLGRESAICQVSHKIADALQADNYLFNRARFIDAILGE